MERTLISSQGGKKENIFMSAWSGTQKPLTNTSSLMPCCLPCDFLVSRSHPLTARLAVHPPYEWPTRTLSLPCSAYFSTTSWIALYSSCSVFPWLCAPIVGYANAQDSKPLALNSVTSDSKK